MDNWNKYKNKTYKQNLTTIQIPKLICYGNYLLSEILWLTVEGKLRQRHVDKFFENAAMLLQATRAQSSEQDLPLYEIHNYIDKIVKDVLDTKTTPEDLALMLGNLTEIDGANYTFTELIGFVRVLAAQI